MTARFKHRRAGLLALALSLALVTPAMAATTGSLNQTVAITSTLAINVPATAIDFGSRTAGDIVAVGNTGATGGTLVWGTTNQPGGFTMTAAFSNLVAGASSIPATAERVNCWKDAASDLSHMAFPAAPFGCTASYSSSSWDAVTGTAAATMFMSDNPGPYGVRLAFELTIPAAQKAGNYTGTVTFAVTDNP